MLKRAQKNLFQEVTVHTSVRMCACARDKTTQTSSQKNHINMCLFLFKYLI